MYIGRAIPPAASPLSLGDILRGIGAELRGGEKRVDELGDQMRRVLGVDHCFFVSSGKTSLTLILRALRSLYPERHDVIVPAFNCFSVPSAIARAGVNMVVCDIDPQTLDFDFATLRQLVAERNGEGKELPLAIVPAHFFGVSADVERLSDLVVGEDIPIIEDAAQAFGLDCEYGMAGTRGRAGFFSFDRGKGVSAVEGGLIVTSDALLAEAIGNEMAELKPYSLVEKAKLLTMSLILAVFQYPALFWLPKGLPVGNLGETLFDPTFPLRRMSGFQAGLLSHWQRKHLEHSTARRQHRDRVTKLVLESGLNCDIVPLAAGPLLRLPVYINDVKARNMLISRENSLKYGIMGSYPQPVCRLQEFPTAARGDNSGAEMVCRQMVTVPVHPLMGSRDCTRMGELLSRVNRLTTGSEEYDNAR